MIAFGTAATLNTCIIQTKKTLMESNKQHNKQRFIERAMKVHRGEELDYSQVEYVNNRTPVKIIDHGLREDGTEYGEFWQTPSNHLRGQCHPDKKGKRISSSKRSRQEDIIARFKEVHKGENLDYSEVVYKGMHDRVKIISHDLRPDGTEYGAFWQEPVVHLKGCTHPDIARDNQSERLRMGVEEFVRRAREVHKDKSYSYERVLEYVNQDTKVEVICNHCDSKGRIHGPFPVTPNNHLRGKGCPKCGNHLSNGEDELMEHIRNVLPGETVVKRDRTVLKSKELDIYIPGRKIAFEFNGIRWHSEKFGKDRHYHIDKMNECRDAGVTLYHIFEDEYLFHRELLLSMVDGILGVGEGHIVVDTSECHIREITKREAMEFLEKYHMQGYASCTLCYGAFNDNFLVGVMAFRKRNGRNDWTLVRHANYGSYVMPYVTSMLFEHFVREHRPDSVRTFLDRRWIGNPEDCVYLKCGFELDGYIAPDYMYANGHGKRLNKSEFRKKVLSSKHGFPISMTESEMARKLGYYRIWDCGMISFLYDNSKDSEH